MIIDKRKRLAGSARRAILLIAACNLAVKRGYMQVTREAIAAECEVSPALVSYMLGSAHQMRREILRAAVAKEIIPIIAQGLAMRNPVALRAPAHLVRAAAELIGAGTTP